MIGWMTLTLTVLAGLGALARASWVQGPPDAWTLIVRNGTAVRAGIGLTAFKRPTDQRLSFPAAVQRVRFQADFVDAELLGGRLEAFALWSVNPDAPLAAYRRLGLVHAAHQPSGHLLTRAQHHAFQQALSALVRRHAGRHRLADLARNPAPLLEAVHADASAQLGELGVLVEDLQLLSVDASDDDVVSALAAPAEEAIRRTADQARDASARARDQLHIAAAKARDLADLEQRITLQRETERLAKLEREAADVTLTAELARAQRRAEAEVEHTRLRTEAEQEKGAELRAHELACLQVERLAEAVGKLPLSDARVVHIGEPLGQLARWLAPGEA